MNYHPFELKIEQLEAINKELETISEAEAAKTNGGLTPTNSITTKATGEEGGRATTFAIGEEGGHQYPSTPLITTLSCDETGC